MSIYRLFGFNHFLVDFDLKRNLLEIIFENKQNNLVESSFTSSKQFDEVNEMNIYH